MARARSRAQTKIKPQKKVIKKPSLLFSVFLAIIIAYVLLTMLGPIDQATLDRYNLSPTKVRLLNLTVVLPFSAIWLSAYYGYSRIKKYSIIVRSSNEGPGFAQIANGLGLLAFSLPTNSLVTASMNAITLSHPSYTVPLTIFRNYLALILPLLAFSLICRGSAKLAGLVRQKKLGRYTQELWSLGVILMCGLFTWLIISRPADTRSPLNVYQLPEWLIVTTIAVPYLYIWFRGIASAYYITSYQRNVKGQLYRSSLRRLSAGVMVVIVINILVQIIISVSSRLYRLQLTPILLIVYGLIALYAVGFGLIASGAMKLKKIEDV